MIRPFAAVLCLLAALSGARADVTLFPLFSDHAVLQAAGRVPIWGKAAPGEPVTVTLGKIKATATADAAGKWTAALDLHDAGPGPFDLVAEGRASRAAATDVLVGQVWLCSGQSNMEWPLRSSAGGKEEAARSANPLLRHFQVETNASPVPLDTIKGKWLIAGPDTSLDFTAVGYYFGKRLQEETRAPVGLIKSSWGGTPIEAWTSEPALATDPALKTGAEKARRDSVAFEAFLPKYKAWQDKYGRKDKPADTADNFANPAGTDAHWRDVTLPGTFPAGGLPDAGVVWVRRTVNLPASAAGKAVEVFLGDVRDSVEAYWNGKKFASGDVSTIIHRYTARADSVVAGDNVLALRIFNPAHGAGIAPGPARFRLDYKGGSMQLAGPWTGMKEYEFPPLAAGQEPIPPKPTVPRPRQHVASYLFNGMIAPLIPCAVKGILWYQGEQNTGTAWQYRTSFPLMIRDWRARWGAGDLPFYYCQLANYGPRQPTPGPTAWAELRDAQNVALTLPATGEAVLIDTDEDGNLHPVDKRSPGERLARIALALSYGKKVEYSGPVFDGLKFESGKAQVHFKHAEGGLVAVPLPATYKPNALDPATKPLVRNSPAGELEGFAVCGADRKWKWAAARIEGDSVVVSSAEVPAPVAVRYAWADNPLSNLANKAGLPAGPFRTDDFPAMTVKAEY